MISKVDPRPSFQNVTKSIPARVWVNTLTSDHSGWLSSRSSGSPQVGGDRVERFRLITRQPRGQLERDHERHPEGGVRRLGRLSPQLLRQPVRRSSLLRRVRPYGPVRPGQRGGGRPDETPGGVSQTGTVSQSSLTADLRRERINLNNRYHAGQF